MSAIRPRCGGQFAAAARSARSTVTREPYHDLEHRERGELKALGSEMADDDHWYVEKKDVDYELWNRLLGIRAVKRTGTG